MAPLGAGVDSWVAFDVECINTRLSPLHLGFVEVIGGLIARRRDWVVRTPGEILHGLRCGGWTSTRGQTVSPEQYGRAPLFADAWPEMAKFIDGRPVVAHNAGARDVAALRRGCDDVGVPWPELTFACSLALARRVWLTGGCATAVVCCYQLHHLARRLFPEAGLYQPRYDLVSYLHADPVEDAEAAAHLVLAAQETTRTQTLAELLAVTGCSLRHVEPDRYQQSERTWASRAPIRVPQPRAINYRDGELFARTVQASCQDIRANWRGDPALIARCLHPRSCTR
ncbi:UNVERIFIED_ORG: DNA polymerase-3 subunit epsilon [Microbispora rosea subsp. rosea]